MGEHLRINGSVRIPMADIVVRASRSSGPGGQHANVTASRIEVTVDLRTAAGLSEAQRARAMERLGPVARAVAQDARSQSRNRDLALERLAQRVREALYVEPPRRPTRPTAGSKRRRVEAKGRRGQVKQQRRRPRMDD
ncbi:MAG: alternative ribosome rescue aminoacyl-tRNA hydrolase ArfB [Solirubrobacteraceae bacterium]